MGRQAGYAQFTRDQGEAILNILNKLDTAGMEQARQGAVEQWPLLQFMAPERTWKLATAAVSARNELWLSLTGEPFSVDRVFRNSLQIDVTIRSLLAAMRNDLGLEVAAKDMGRARGGGAWRAASPREEPPSPEGG